MSKNHIDLSAMSKELSLFTLEVFIPNIYSETFVCDGENKLIENINTLPSSFALLDNSETIKQIIDWTKEITEYPERSLIQKNFKLSNRLLILRIVKYHNIEAFREYSTLIDKYRYVENSQYTHRELTEYFSKVGFSSFSDLESIHDWKESLKEMTMGSFTNLIEDLINGKTEIMDMDKALIKATCIHVFSYRILNDDMKTANRLYFKFLTNKINELKIIYEECASNLAFKFEKVLLIGGVVYGFAFGSVYEITLGDQDREVLVKLVDGNKLEGKLAVELYFIGKDLGNRL